MRLSLLSDDNDVAELLINKAMELMSQAETAAAEGNADGVGDRDREQAPGDADNGHH
jgi:hypothetical protein